jgi:hypothetical protein
VTAIEPKAGLLSGMAVTWITASIALGVGLFVPSLHPIFAGTASLRLQNLLLISIGLMVAHKIESYYTREFDHCPVYLSLKQAGWARDPRQAVFVTFCSVFLALMIVIALAMRGPPWLLLLPAVWCAQGLHEMHHFAKSLARRSYYSGTATGLCFVLFIDLVFFPAYVGELGIDGAALRWAFYLAQPPLFAAFVVEDLRWLGARARLAVSG